MHINPPLGVVQAVRFKSSFLTKTLDFVNVFIAAIVPPSWVAFGVFVSEAGAKALLNSTTTEVLVVM